jgi:hypothetical protein
MSLINVDNEIISDENNSSLIDINSEIIFNEVNSDAISSSSITTRKNPSPIHEHFIINEKTQKMKCKHCR